MKSDIRTWLASADFRKIVEAARSSNRTVSTLITLTYDNDLLICWRAIDAIGRCAVDLSAARPRVYKNYLRRLFWMMTDESGAVAPHAPEAIGEIIRSNPAEFVDFIPLTLSLLNLEPEDKPLFLPGILYALGRIGEASPDKMENCLENIEKCLLDPNPQARVMAILCFERLRAHKILLRHRELDRDGAGVRIYCEENILTATVGGIYSETAMRLSSK